jgi:hypothetical protein
MSDDLNSLTITEDESAVLLSRSDGLSVVSLTSTRCLAFLRFDSPVISADMVPDTALAVLASGNLIFLYNLIDGSLIHSEAVESSIVSVRMNPKRIIVMLDLKIIVFEFISRFRKIKEIEINSPILSKFSKPDFGLISFISGDNRLIILDSYTLQLVADFSPHTSPVTAVEITDRFIFTASQKGTIIRVFEFNRNSGQVNLFCVFRRGRTESPIRSLAVSGEFLGVIGDSETAHVFRVPTERPGDAGILPSEYTAVRDFAFIKLRKNSPNDKYVRHPLLVTITSLRLDYFDYSE